MTNVRRGAWIASALAAAALAAATTRAGDDAKAPADLPQGAGLAAKYKGDRGIAKLARFAKGAPRGEWTGMGLRLLEKSGEPFEGLRWRKSKDLLLNYFWLLHYVTEHSAKQARGAPQDPVSRVFFDDVVVATEYVGPLGE